MVITDKVELQETKPIALYIKKALEEKKYSKIKIYFNFFKNTMLQYLTRFKLYPLDEESLGDFVSFIELEESELSTDENRTLIVEPNLAEFNFAAVNPNFKITDRFNFDAIITQNAVKFNPIIIKTAVSQNAK